MEEAANPQRMRYAFRVEGKTISQTQAIKQIIIAKMSIEILRNKETFRDTM